MRFKILKVMITKEFVVDTEVKSKLPIVDQIARNINGWQWSGSEIEAVQIKETDEFQPLWSNFLEGVNK